MAKPRLFKKVKNFIDDLEKKGGKPLYELTPEEARQVLLNVQKQKVKNPKTEVEKIMVETNAGRKMAVQIVRPVQEKSNLPIVFYIHGGGWVMGNEVTHEHLITSLAENVGAAIVFPIYEPSPENKHKEMIADLFSVLKYFATNGKQYNLDVDNLVVAGDSVGGDMATVMTMMAKENNFVPKIKFQLLFYPVMAAEFDTKSYDDFSEGPWLTKKAMQWFWDAYTMDEEERNCKYASPLKATIEELKDLPPALVITDENDVLRDEGEDYARKLDEAGVDVASVRFNGTIHDFVMLNGLAASEPSRTALLLAEAQLKQVFAK